MSNGDTFSKITDTIFSVLVSFSFIQYAWLIAPPQVSFRLGMLIFVYLAAVFSRVGFHKSISPMPYKGSKRFFIDLWILYSYFLLITSPEPVHDRQEHMLRLLVALVFVGIGYFLWDVMKRQEYPKRVPFARIIISLLFLLTSIQVLGFYWLLPTFHVSLAFGRANQNLAFLLVSSANLIFYWALKYKAPVDEEEFLSRKRSRALQEALRRLSRLFRS